MNWKLIFLLSLFGLMMGVISVFGLLKEDEWIFWIVIGVVSAAILARFVKKKHFSHGFYLGLLNTILATLVQVIFFAEFLSNNSQYEDHLESLSSGFDYRLLYLILAPFVGVISGSILGVMTFSAAKFIAVTSGEKK